MFGSHHGDYDMTDMWKVKDIARRWGVSESWVYRRCASGELPHFQAGPRTTIFIDGVEAELWFASHRKPTGKQKT
jgi:hypothetical protein